jgi:hypothetical protein
MATSHNDKLAVLIDADNAQASIINELMAEVSRYGTATVKRAYGDWTTQNLRGWKDMLHKLAIQPMQHHWQERDGFVSNHRRYGLAAFRHGQRLLSGFFGQ